MAELKHRVVTANGIRIHLVEVGKGPLVLMVHGFPESWYSWRHQLHALADAGYRAAAIDVRGYGRSSAPAGIDEYRMTKHVADNLGVVDALGEKSATIVGHDWGAPIAANSALLRPDVFRALALLSVPYSPRGARRPSEAFRAMGGKEEFYIEYFQQPGRAEAEIEPDVRRMAAGLLLLRLRRCARTGCRRHYGHDSSWRQDARPVHDPGKAARLVDGRRPRFLRQRI